MPHGTMLRWLVVATLALGPAGCSLGLFQDPPNEDAGDAGDDAGEVEVGADGDADGADGDADVSPGCGNGVEDDGEECDDGNEFDDDGCDNDCTWSCTLDVHCRDTETCNGAETCDTASHTCADGVDEENGTECVLPDGGTGGCRSGVCRPLTCGDGTLDDGEDCDDGNENDNDRCPSTCFEAVCGDGFVWDEVGGVEECDDGNDVEADGCDSDCTWSCDVRGDCDDDEPCNGEETCTDHACTLLSPPLEEGESCTTSSGAAGTCSAAMCMPATCGNATIEAGEECDDGGHVAGDGCEPNCLQSCHTDADCDETPTDNPCTDDSCSGADPTTNGRLCVHFDNTAACDDRDPCTEHDSCRDGICAGPVLDGDDDGWSPDGCGGGGDCNDTLPTVNPGATELCNLVDDDCDLLTDEDWPELGRSCYTGLPSTTLDVGRCHGGTWVCDPTVTAGARCDGEVVPSAEVRDGADDDCDGVVDNGFWTAWTNVGGNVFLNDVWVDPAVDIAFTVGYDQVTGHLIIAQWLPTPGGWGVVLDAPVTMQALHSVWGFGLSDAWAVGTDGLLFRWDGTVWSSVAAPWSTTTMYAVWGANPSTVWAVGAAGTAYRWNGATWTSTPASTAIGANNLNGVCGTPDAVWAVGVNGKIAHWNGSAWSDESIPGFSGELNDCWAIANDNVWAVGPNGVILHRSSTPVWTPQASGSIADLQGIWGTPTWGPWAVANSGWILRISSPTWFAEPSPTGIDLTAIHGRGGSDALAIAVDRQGDIFRWRP